MLVFARDEGDMYIDEAARHSVNGVDSVSSEYETRFMI